ACIARAARLRGGAAHDAVRSVAHASRVACVARAARRAHDAADTRFGVARGVVAAVDDIGTRLIGRRSILGRVARPFGDRIVRRTPFARRAATPLTCARVAAAARRAAGAALVNRRVALRGRIHDRSVGAALPGRPFEDREIVGARQGERRRRQEPRASGEGPHSDPPTPTNPGPTTTDVRAVVGALDGALTTKSTTPAARPTAPAASPTFAIVWRECPVEMSPAFSGGQGPPWHASFNSLNVLFSSEPKIANVARPAIPTPPATYAAVRRPPGDESTTTIGCSRGCSGGGAATSAFGWASTTTVLRSEVPSVTDWRATSAPATDTTMVTVPGTTAIAPPSVARSISRSPTFTVALSACSTESTRNASFGRSSRCSESAASAACA